MEQSAFFAVVSAIAQYIAYMDGQRSAEEDFSSIQGKDEDFNGNQS